MTTADLEVVKAYPNDVARDIARLNPDTLFELSPGDVVALEGDDTTTAKVWRADRKTKPSTSSASTGSRVGTRSLTGARR